MKKKKIEKLKELDEKKRESFLKFYEEYKNLSLEELQKTYQGFKNPPGGVKKMALLQLATEKMASMREQTMKEAAESVAPIREEIKQEEISKNGE